MISYHRSRIVFLLLFTSFVYAAPPVSSVAVVSKVILDVRHKKIDKEWERAQRGETLASGDRVKTGEKSVAIVKFKDNSLVRVRELSELTVTGETRGSSFSKSVNVEKGVVGFNIHKQRTDEEFRFTSPTSVASIRGTGGQFTAQELSDTLVVVEGVVHLTNKVSSRSVEVQAGFTGISMPDGSVQARPSTAEERQVATQAARTAELENKLELEFLDGKGSRKVLKIEYK